MLAGGLARDVRLEGLPSHLLVRRELMLFWKRGGSVEPRCVPHPKPVWGVGICSCPWPTAFALHTSDYVDIDRE